MDTVTIDVASVPREVRDDMAHALLTKVADYFGKPGVEDDFQAWLKEYKKRKPATSVAG